MVSRLTRMLLGALCLLSASAALGQGDFLPPEEAFRVEITRLAPDAVELRWDVADGYYLYRERLDAAIEGVGEAALGEMSLPAGEQYDDPYFGRMEIYREPFSAVVPLPADAPQRFDLRLGYQGCADAGICYPPSTTTVSVNMADAVAGSVSSASIAASTGAADAASGAGGSEQDRLAAMLGESALPAVLAIFFGMGLLLAFTPCVLPMVPILSSIIVGQGASQGGRRGFVLSLAYVLPMAATYALVGTLAGLAGANLQASLQQPWVIGLFSAVFVLLALAMFGFYRLQMPQFIQNRLIAASDRQRGGSLIGVAVMGVLSAAIVGPCMTAPLAGALLYIGQTGDAVIGGLALFALGLGMGVPLLIVGTIGARVLPKAGPWMTRVQVIFGFVLLGVAIWMLSRIVPGPVTLAMSGALLVALAVALGALEPLPEGVPVWRRAAKGLGVLAGLWAVALVLGAAAGSSSLLQPLAGLSAGAGSASPADTEVTADFVPVRGFEDFQRQLALAQSEGRPVVVDFYADWCVSCKIMEREVFGHPEVQRAMADVVRLRPDVTANDEADKALLRDQQVVGPPTLIFYTADGEERRAQRIVGEVGPEEFLQHLNDAFEGA